MPLIRACRPMPDKIEETFTLCDKRVYSSCSDQLGAHANETVYLDRMTSSLDRSRYPSLLTAGRYYGDDYTRMKWSPDAVTTHCRMQHFDHLLQPSPALAASHHRLADHCSGTTNVAAEGPEMPCCDGRRARPPSLLADVIGVDDVTSGGSAGTVVVAGESNCPASVCLYESDPRDESAFHV